MLKLMMSLLLMLMVPVSPASAETDKDTAEALMRKSGLWQQLGDVAPQMRTALLDALAQGGAQLSPSEAERMARAVDGAYAADRLRATALREIMNRVDAAHVRALRGWFDSSTGVTMRKLEEAAAADLRDPATIVQEGMATLAKVSPSRRALLEQIVSVTRSAEAMTTMTINTTVAIERGIASAAPGTQGQTTNDTLKELEAQRPKMLESFASISLAMYAKTYASVSDSDLASYVAFLDSAAGQHFTEITLRALDAALTDAAKNFGRSIPSAKDRANA